MDIDNMSLVELKALWHDQFMAKAAAEQNMNVISQAIANRKQKEQEGEGND